jgi:hypothetical protein
VPSGFVSVIEALVVLGVLAVDRARSVAGERGQPTAGAQAA